MSILRTQDGTVIVVASGHVVSARDLCSALAEIRRREAQVAPLGRHSLSLDRSGCSQIGQARPPSEFVTHDDEPTEEGIALHGKVIRICGRAQRV
jgi:hypothetical protein